MAGKLYVVATPIGNLEDITIRAINTLKNVDIIAAEDTRHTLRLLNYLEISKPLISYHRHNEDIKTELLINKLLEGNNIALVSDAGTPAISDPGEEIVKECINSNIEVISIPGACAAITALVSSGMNTKEFTFIGFLPINKKLRKNKLDEIKDSKNTIIIYEAPHKLNNTLKDLEKIIPHRSIVLARELTKIHEEFIRGKIEEISDKIVTPKGEYVLIIEGNKEINNEFNAFEDISLEEHYEYYKQKGYIKKEIIKKIAKDRNKNKNDIYMKFLNKND